MPISIQHDIGDLLNTELEVLIGKFGEHEKIIRTLRLEFDRLFGTEVWSIFQRIVFKTTVLCPAASKIAFNTSVVEDLPFVPVTAMIVIFFAGKRKTRAPR